MDLSKLNINDFKHNNLKNVEFNETRIFDSEDKLLPFFEKMDFKNLRQLKLISCHVTKFYGNFFTKFSPFLSTLNLRNNDIIYVSPLISKLYGLKDLDLSGNKNLSNNGFFFEDLPTFILSLILEETSITKIPEEIKRLESLSYLSVDSKELKARIQINKKFKVVNFFSLYHGKILVQKLKYYALLEEMEKLMRLIFMVKIISKTFNFVIQP